jgi:hypothetical protein
MHLPAATAAPCDASLQGLVFDALPASLAGNGTRQLEVLDLSGSAVLGGSLPAVYSSWSNLTKFK